MNDSTREALDFVLDDEGTIPLIFDRLDDLGGRVPAITLTTEQLVDAVTTVLDARAPAYAGSDVDLTLIGNHLGMIYAESVEAV